MFREQLLSSSCDLRYEFATTQMHASSPAFLSRFLALALRAALSATAHATVTKVAWYRLGENDPGAASGVVLTDTVGDNPAFGFNRKAFSS